MFQKAYRVFCRIEEVFVGLCFLGVVGLTFTNAVLRYFGTPIVTAEDLCLLLFPWAAFVGANVALRHSRLIGMDMFVNKFSPKTRKSFQLLVCLIMIGALALLIPLGFRLAFGNWSRILNSLPISFGYVTLSLPVASILMIFTLTLKVKNLITNFNNDSYVLKKDILGAAPPVINEKNTENNAEAKKA